MQLRILSLLALTAVCAAASELKLAPLLAADSPTAVEGEYIVVLKEELADQDVKDHKSVVRNLMGFHNFSEIMSEYSIGKGFRGYSSRMTDKLRDTVLAMNHVKYMERNQEMHILQADCTAQTGSTSLWGLVRTSQDKKFASGQNYDYDANVLGDGVEVYIIDTGIYASHSDFGGRASAPAAADFIDGTGNDGNGHGTHCAGTVMANTWGVAKKATAIGVRVLNNSGSGSTAGVISGVNYVANQHSSSKKSVANMSLGGGFSTSMNNAVNSAVDKGVHFSVAAGNEAQSACNVSPASADKPVTVAASDIGDQIAFFSNYGTCTDIIAPGVDVTSTWNNGGTNTISGTSMSAPHVAGVIAKYLSESGTSYTPASMKQKLSNNASKNKISGLTGVRASTPNEVALVECA